MRTPILSLVARVTVWSICLGAIGNLQLMQVRGAGGKPMMQFAKLADRPGQCRPFVEQSFLDACLSGEHRGIQQLCGTAFVVLRQLRCHAQQLEGLSGEQMLCQRIGRSVHQDNQLLGCLA
jgi:hypothetical protein